MSSTDFDQVSDNKRNRTRFSGGSAGAAVALAVPTQEFEPLELVSSGGPVDSFAYLTVKRAFDLAFATCVLVLLSPVLLFIALAVKLTSRGPVLFRQERVGRRGGMFHMLKFRTMAVRPQSETDTVWTVPVSDRITPFGRFLRRTSLDELPQFINVLRGEMSVVGPRPERPFFVEEFQKRIEGYSCRHDGVVGITGWAQVNGLRGDTCIQTRVAYDVYYLRNWSLLFDARIICRTVLDVLRHSHNA